MECPYCKRHVNESAISCPNCGKQLRFNGSGYRVLKAFGILTTVWFIVSMINVYVGIAIFGAAFAASGVLVRKRNLKFIKQAADTVSWPSVTGIVKKSRVYGDGETYNIDITYEYSLGDKVYVNDKIQFADMDLSESGAPQIQARYPAGSSVSVYYNPANPTESVLEKSFERAKSAKNTSLLLIISGVGMIIATIAVYILK